MVPALTKGHVESTVIPFFGLWRDLHVVFLMLWLLVLVIIFCLSALWLNPWLSEQSCGPADAARQTLLLQTALEEKDVSLVV